ncbi:MAG: hypothetical protein ACI9TH_001764 [Kiritimatiellia bacterium]|jgi:hypothetical protein
MIPYSVPNHLRAGLFTALASTCILLVTGISTGRA